MYIAVGTADGAVSILGRDLSQIVQSLGGLNLVSWSPDSRWIASCSEQSDIFALEVDSGLSLAFALDDRLRDLSWSPGGELLVVAGRAGVYFLEVIRPSGGAPAARSR
jgi:WD40 repeat protein